MGVCNCSMFCCTLIYVHSSIAIILMGKRELVALLNLSFWCLVMVERLFLAVSWGCLLFVIVVFLDQTHLLFLTLTTNPDLITDFDIHQGMSDYKAVTYRVNLSVKRRKKTLTSMSFNTGKVILKE